MHEKMEKNIREMERGKRRKRKNGYKIEFRKQTQLSKVIESQYVYY